MDPLPLIPIDPKGLRVFSNERDVLRDLMVYLDYAREHSIKRMARTNEIPRGDLQKISKWMGGLTFEPGPDEVNASGWIHFIDELAYRLHLVTYDIKGEYRGESSAEPSFLNNYVVVDKAPYHKFIELSPLRQEKRILETLVSPQLLSSYRDQDVGELFETSVLGELDYFDSWGVATGVIPSLKFREIRMFLLDLLAQCATGVWYSTASLVGYLKVHHPYFLIPANIPPDRWGKTPGRYDNFHEGKDRWSSRESTVPIAAPDAFERVEGRYVERFLENVPLILRFVDVAYDPEPYRGDLPMREVLKAFRVNERFLCLRDIEESPPRVTVQPNLDVVIESDFYPVKIVGQVMALAEQISSPSSGGAYVGVFQLKKTCVAAERALHPDLDVIGLLQRLSRRDLPPNVQVELEEWTGHAEQFILYEGFDLLESEDGIPEAETITRERIGPSFSLVSNAENLIITLEEHGRVPLLIVHPDQEFAPVPDTAVSVFPKRLTRIEAEAAPVPVKISRVISVTVKFQEKEPFDAVLKVLAQLRCPFQSDIKNCTITFNQKYQALFDEAVQKLAASYAIQSD